MRDSCLNQVDSAGRRLQRELAEPSWTWREAWNLTEGWRKECGAMEGHAGSRERNQKRYVLGPPEFEVVVSRFFNSLGNSL